MRTNFLSMTLTAGLASAAPFSFPLPNGFPENQDPVVMKQTAAIAHGTLSNAPLPATINDDTLTSFKAIAFNEIFEVAFFTDLINNITNKVPGYEMYDMSRIGDLQAIQAQEQLHALTANTILAHYGANTIKPCKYQFPVTNLPDALNLAQTFTDVVLGVLNDVQTRITTTVGPAGAGVVSAISQVIGNEAQQDGYFRYAQKLQPSAQPFVTGASRAFVLTALNPFLVPGSCPSLPELQAKLPTFPPLMVADKSKANNGDISFTAMPTGSAKIDPSTQKIVYINGANVPVVMDFTATQAGSGYTVTAPFKAIDNNFWGLTLAAIVNSTGPFVTAGDVADKTVFGPALVEFF